MTDKTKLDEAVSLNVSTTQGNLTSTTTFTADDAMALAVMLKNAGIAGNSESFNGPATLTLDAQSECGGSMNSTIQAPDLRTIMNLLEPEFQAAGDMEAGIDDMAADMEPEMGAEMEPETGVEIYDPGMGPDDFSPDKGSEVDMGDDMGDLEETILRENPEDFAYETMEDKLGSNGTDEEENGYGDMCLFSWVTVTPEQFAQLGEDGAAAQASAACDAQLNGADVSGHEAHMSQFMPNDYDAESGMDLSKPALYFKTWLSEPLESEDNDLEEELVTENVDDDQYDILSDICEKVLATNETEGTNDVVAGGDRMSVAWVRVPNATLEDDNSHGEFFDFAERLEQLANPPVGYTMDNHGIYTNDYDAENTGVEFVSIAFVFYANTGEEGDIEEEAEFDYRTNDVHPHAWAGTADKKPVQTGTKRVSARSGDNPLEEAAPGGSDFFETWIEDEENFQGEFHARVGFDWDSGDFATGLDHMPTANMGSSLEITSVVNLETGEDVLERLDRKVIDRLEQEAAEQDDGSKQYETAKPKSFGDYIKEAELNELSRGTVSNYVKKVNDDNYDDADDHKLAKRGRGLGNAQAKIYWGDSKVPTSEDLMNEFTQLDELSPATKQAYIDKAQASKAHHEKKAGDADDRLWDRWASKNIGGKSSPEAEHRLTKYMNKHDSVAKKREKGLDRAGGSTDQMDESDFNSAALRAREDSKNGYVQHVDRHDDGAHSVSDWMSDKTVASFSNGRNTGGQDIDEEALDELSNATKNSYFKKAAAQINQHGQHAANDRELGNHASADDHEAVIMKRAHGMNKAIAKEGELDEAGANDYERKARQYGEPFYLNTDCGYASLNDIATHEYFDHGGVVVLEIDRNGKKGLNFVAGHDTTAPGTKVTCVTATSSGQKYRPGKVVDSFTMDEYQNDRAGLEKRLAAHGISPTKKLSVKTFD